MASTPTLTSRMIISHRRVWKPAEKPLLNAPPSQRRDTSIVSITATTAAITNAAISPKTISRRNQPAGDAFIAIVCALDINESPFPAVYLPWERRWLTCADRRSLRVLRSVFGWGSANGARPPLPQCPLDRRPHFGLADIADHLAHVPEKLVEIIRQAPARCQHVGHDDLLF